MLNFFKSYRAYVRAKVTSFMHDNPSIGKTEREEIAKKARKYYWLSLYYARLFSKQKPLIIISCGLPGSGKSRWLKFAADIAGGTLLRTDTARMKIFKLTGKEEITEAHRKKYYSKSARQKVYEHIFRKADRILSLGGNAAIDATFANKKNRDKAKKLAKKHCADFIIIYTTCRQDTSKLRIEKRKTEKSNVSRADFKNAYFKLKDEFSAPKKDSSLITIDTEKTAYENILLLKERLHTLAGIK